MASTNGAAEEGRIANTLCDNVAPSVLAVKLRLNGLERITVMKDSTKHNIEGAHEVTGAVKQKIGHAVGNR